MTKKIYTPEHIEFLRQGYTTMSAGALTRVFNARFGMDKTAGTIKAALKNHGITCGRKGRDRFWPPSKLYTPEQAAFLRNNYTGRSLAELTALFNGRFDQGKTQQQIRTFVRNRGIKSGRTGQFEKGHRTWNAGTKGLTHGSSTSFRKGSIPKNRKPLGSERIDKDGYIQIKIAERDPHTGFPTRYKLKHVVIWERAQGPAPQGMAVVFRDGDKLNCVLENLMLVSRAELLRLNQYRYAGQPPEIQPSVLALAKMEVKTFALMKENGRKET